MCYAIFHGADTVEGIIGLRYGYCHHSSSCLYFKIDQTTKVGKYENNISFTVDRNIFFKKYLSPSL